MNKKEKTQSIEHQKTILFHMKDSKDIKNISNDKDIIMDTIKKELEPQRLNVEIINSELYTIKQYNHGEHLSKELNEQLEKSDQILEKIKNIKKTYYILKENNDISKIINLSDISSIDDVISLRENMDETFKLSETISDYKVLKDYLYLIEELKDVMIDSDKLIDECLGKKEEIEKRDEKFKIFCENVIDIETINKNVDEKIETSNARLNELNEKIGIIDKDIKTKYYLTGLDDILTSSIGFLASLTVAPKMGLIPGIALISNATGNMFRNLRKGIQMEKKYVVEYSTHDYNDQIQCIINDASNVNDIIDNALDNVNSFKEEFEEQFEKYKNLIPEYEEILLKLEKVEKQLKENKIKTALIQEKLDLSKSNNKQKRIR